MTKVKQNIFSTKIDSNHIQIKKIYFFESLKQRIKKEDVLLAQYKRGYLC